MEFKNELKLLGLNGYEAEVYDALLRVNQARVRELAPLVRVPRPQIYVALRQLAERGMVRVGRGRVGCFSAVPPRDAFGTVLRQGRQRIEQQEKTIERLNRAFGERKEPKVPSGVVEVLRTGSDSFLTALKGAKREVLSMMRFPAGSAATTRKGAGLADRAEAALLRKKVRVRCLYHPEVLTDEFELGRMRKLVRLGEETRLSKELPTNLVIVDDTAAAFSLPTSSDSHTTYMISEPMLVVLLRLAFEEAWRKSRSLNGREPKRRK